jgi:hypothetical protein
MSSLSVRPAWGVSIELIRTSVVILIVRQDRIAVFKCKGQMSVADDAD